MVNEIGKELVYFAHPFDKWRTDEEKLVKELLEHKGFKVFNPFDEENALNVKYGVDNYYDNPTYEFAGEIVDKDFQRVDECDSLFAWIPKDITTIGTIREIDRALRDKKRVMVVCYKPNPFLRETDLYLSIEDFLNDKQYIWKSCYWKEEYKELQKEEY